MTPPKPPSDLKARGRGRKFLEALHKEYDGLRLDEYALALEAARLMDLADELRAVVKKEGPMATGSTGQKVVHPALQELRATRGEIRQHFRQLGLPDPETGETDASKRARHAAEARHRRSA